MANKTLLNEQIIKIEGIDIKVRPLRVKQMKKHFIGLEKLATAFSEKGASGVFTVLDPDVLDFIATAIGQGVDYVEGLALDELALIVTAILELNASRFLESVLPRVQKLMAKLNKMTEG